MKVILQIQDKGEATSEAKTGSQVAISLNQSVVGRHIFEKDIFYVKVPEQDVRTFLTKYQDRLSVSELETLNEFVEIMRRTYPFWAA